MRTVRAVLLAIVVTLALAGGLASTADAGGGPHRTSTIVVGGGDPSTESADPGDPGLPPDP